MTKAASSNVALFRRILSCVLGGPTGRRHRSSNARWFLWVACAVAACGGGDGVGDGGGPNAPDAFSEGGSSVNGVDGEAAESGAGKRDGGGSAESGIGVDSSDPGAAEPGDIVNGAMQIVPSAYVSMAAMLSQSAGVDYRYGPSATTIGSPVGNGALPTLFANDAPTPLSPPAPSYTYYWQVGGPPSANAGAYSSDWAQAIFVADDPTQRVGVTDVQVTTYMYNTFAQLPQLSWTRDGVPGGGLDQVNILTDKNAGIVSGNPIATGRCGGRPGFCPQSVVTFQNGIIASAGGNTANNNATAQLGAHKIPTAIAMTNDSEYALVTLWDTEAIQGQVAVVALAGLCDGCDPYNNGTNGQPAYYDFWHEWEAVYPGLPNMGDIAFMKILGYVDLPDMKAPTEIAVTTGMDQFQTLAADGTFIGLPNTPLTSNWQNFTSAGPNYGNYAKGGVAVVISKSEQKVAFIDLAPLFSYLNGIYFSSEVTQASNLGMADNQWPYTFTYAPLATPTVITTLSLPARPTAVKTNLWGSPARAWVATQDGTMHIFAIDGYARGATPPTPTPSSVAEVGTVTGIGRNPTRLALSKGEPDSSVDPVNQQVIITSRGDRQIAWARFSGDGNGATLVRTLQDTRLVDPISVEDSDDFATTTFLVDVTDYAGRAVRSYRYGPVIFTDGGACPSPAGCPVTPTGPTLIEYGGSMDFPGMPYQITSANEP